MSDAEYRLSHIGDLTWHTNLAGDPPPVRVMGVRLFVGKRNKVVDIPMTEKEALEAISALARWLHTHREFR